MDAEQKRFYFRMTLMILGWAGVCGLLYFFLLKPFLKDDKPADKKVVKQQQPPSKQQTPNQTEQQPDTQAQQDPFEITFTKNDIAAAQKVLDQFTQILYTGNRTSRDAFVNSLKPYTTDDYLTIYKQSNGLGEPIKIKQKKLSYIEQGTSIPEGWMGFNCVIVSDKDVIFSRMYFLVRESGTWRVKEEADSFVPDE